MLRSIHRNTTVLESLFKVCNFIKNRHQHKCFPMNIAKFLRTPILKNIWERLLPKVAFYKCNHCETSQKYNTLFDEHIVALNAGIYGMQPEILMKTQPTVNFHSIFYELQYYLYTLKLLGSSEKYFLCRQKRKSYLTRCKYSFHNHSWLISTNWLIHSFMIN